MEKVYNHGGGRSAKLPKGTSPGYDAAMGGDLLVLTDSSGKKAYFRAGPGGRLEPVREGKDGIISIHVVCREDVAKSLRYAKCQGTDEEIDTLLKSGLQGKLDGDSGNTYDIIHQAVDDAVIEGSIDCSDEKKQQQRNIESRRKKARLLLEKNWCHEISCCECTYCIADIACSSWGKAIYDPRLPDCISYDCEEQLILVEKEDKKNRLRLPFVAEFGIEGVSMDDILAASTAYDCREEVEEFMSAAKLRGREVVLRTIGEII